jgi:sporulation protein YlmC with PRC-barrel domain
MKRIRIGIPSAAIAMLSLFLQAASLAQEDAPRGHATAVTGPSLQVMRVQQFIDMSVQNQQGERLGKIEDVVIDTADGRIAYTALDSGLLDPLLAVPWKTLRVAQDKSTVTLDVAKEALQKAPTFRRENWPDTVDPDWLASVYSYYGYPSYPGLTEITVRHVRLVRSTTLQGLNVRSPEREELGKIEDLVVDLREGYIAYVILGRGGLLGVGKTIHAVPWTAMKIEPIERVAVLYIEKEKLDNAPPLEEGTWQETASRKWLTGIYAYYGARPYWDEGT